MRITFTVVLVVGVLLGFSSYASAEGTAVDPTCDVADAHPGIVGACHAYHNPPKKIENYLMDTEDTCYTLGKMVYDDIIKMSAGKSEAAYAAYDAAAEEGLRQTYYACKQDHPVLENAPVFLQRMGHQ